jgi:hypothetical protein
MDYGGKRSDVVDVGGEIDYSNYQWFQDVPQKPQAVRSVYILVSLLELTRL